MLCILQSPLPTFSLQFYSVGCFLFLLSLCSLDVYHLSFPPPLSPYSSATDNECCLQAIRCWLTTRACASRLYHFFVYKQQHNSTPPLLCNTVRQQFPIGGNTRSLSYFLLSSPWLFQITYVHHFTLYLCCLLVKPRPPPSRSFVLFLFVFPTSLSQTFYVKGVQMSRGRDFFFQDSNIRKVFNFAYLTDASCLSLTFGPRLSDNLKISQLEG